MFSVALSNVQAGALIGVQDSTTITITDNDVADAADVDVVNTSSGNNGGAFDPLFVLMMIRLVFLYFLNHHHKLPKKAQY